MTEWVRLSRGNEVGFGVIEGDQVISYMGDVFDTRQPDGQIFSLRDLRLECPVLAGALNLGIWNNFDVVRERQHLPRPEYPWYCIKSPPCLLGPDCVIQQPPFY